MMLFYSKTKKIKNFLDPPPSKKGQGYERSQYGYTHYNVCLYQQPVTWISTRLRLGELNYKVIPSLRIIIKIIVLFSSQHFSICDFIYTKENTRSFNVRATHFKPIGKTFNFNVDSKIPRKV